MILREVRHSSKYIPNSSSLKHKVVSKILFILVSFVTTDFSFKNKIFY